jgi:hypothetical protein
MLDSEPARLTKIGTVTIHPTKQGCVQIEVDGFEGQGCSCRDVAALAALWAIGELQRELMLTLQRPGGGALGVN